MVRTRPGPGPPAPRGVGARTPPGAGVCGARVSARPSPTRKKELFGHFKPKGAQDPYQTWKGVFFSVTCTPPGAAEAGARGAGPFLTSAPASSPHTLLDELLSYLTRTPSPRLWQKDVPW